MRTHILNFTKWLLLIWGGFSLAAVIALSIYVVYWFVVASHDKHDTASPHDAHYVLDTCGFSNKQIDQVVHSYISSRGFGGTVDAFEIKISQLDDADFIPKKDYPNEHWYRGDQLPQVLDAAVKLVAEWHDQIPWFPTEAELKNSDVLVFPASIGCCLGVEPTSATLVFVRKADKMAFYLNDNQ